MARPTHLKFNNPKHGWHWTYSNLSLQHTWFKPLSIRWLIFHNKSFICKNTFKNEQLAKQFCNWKSLLKKQRHNRENSLLTYLFTYLFICLSVIYLTTLLLFGITDHRIGGWVAMEKSSWNNWKKFSTFFPTKSEKTINRVEIADISKRIWRYRKFRCRKNEKWEDPKTIKEASRDDIKKQVYTTKTRFYYKRFFSNLEFSAGFQRGVSPTNVIVLQLTNYSHILVS